MPSAELLPRARTNEERPRGADIHVKLAGWPVANHPRRLAEEAHAGAAEVGLIRKARLGGRVRQAPTREHRLYGEEHAMVEGENAGAHPDLALKEVGEPRRRKPDTTGQRSHRPGGLGVLVEPRDGPSDPRVDGPPPIGLGEDRFQERLGVTLEVLNRPGGPKERRGSLRGDPGQGSGRRGERIHEDGEGGAPAPDNAREVWRERAGALETPRARGRLDLDRATRLEGDDEARHGQPMGSRRGGTRQVDRGGAIPMTEKTGPGRHAAALPLPARGAQSDHEGQGNARTLERPPAEPSGAAR